MRAARLVISTVAAAALIPLSATAAFAAPPGNDTPDGAKVISLGDTVKQDTTKATTDSIDRKANRACGAPFTNASVWFSYTPSADGNFLLDMSGSDYSGGFMVFDGPPTARTLINCGPTTLGISGAAGTTYLIVAFSDTEVNGGNLVMSLQEGPPSPSLTVTVDPVGTILKGGRAQLSGTFTCSNADYAEIDGQLTQIWKRVKITGYFTKIVHRAGCDGTEQDWTEIVRSDNGLFAKGAATIRVFTGACGQIDCVTTRFKQSVTLQKSAGVTAQRPSDGMTSSGRGIGSRAMVVPFRGW